MVEAVSVIHRIFYWGGWSAFVAIGTLSLAGVTYGLVRATKILAQRAEADVRAQWAPVLILRESVDVQWISVMPISAPSQGTTRGPGIVRGDGVLRTHVENVGRGPAFDVQAYLEEFDRPGPGYGVPLGVEPLSGAMSSRIYVTIAPGEPQGYEWSNLGADRQEYSGSFTYSGMSGGQYLTRFHLSFDREDRPTIQWQRFEEERIVPFELTWQQRVFPSWLVRKPYGSDV